LLYSVVHFPSPEVIEAVRRYQEPYVGSFEVDIAPHFTIHTPFESGCPPGRFAAILECVCAEIEPFQARLVGVDSFQGKKFVLFMKLAEESRMFRLQEKIDAAITEKDWDDVLGPGTMPRPHITIGFFEKREELEQAEAKLANEKIDLAWTVDAVDLIAEVKPSILKSVGTFRLGG